VEAEELVDEVKDVLEFLKVGRPGPHGFRVNGQKYMVTKPPSPSPSEPWVVYGAKSKPKGGICMTKTKKAILVATWSDDKDQIAPSCNGCLEAVADHFRMMDW
jgi:hypothetical protein